MATKSMLANPVPDAEASPDEVALLMAAPEPDQDDIIENPDGSATVRMPAPGVSKLAEAKFKANLADNLLDELYLHRLAVDTLELIDSDKSARKQRDEQYADGIKRTGLGNDAPGGAQFQGASRVVHPMLAKGCVDFASRAIKELFPAQGPCKTQVIGEQTDAKIERADRKREYMNWQCTTQVAENRAELERLLSQVPLGGSQYKRWWYDLELKRPRTEAVFIDDVFTPYGVSDFYTSPRVAYRQRILKGEYERRVRTGLYRDLDLAPPAPGMTDESESQTASNKIEGVSPDEVAYNDDGVREEYEVYIDLQVEGDPLTKGATAPYVLHLDPTHQRVLGLYRNWKPDDEKREKLHWMSEWPFIPWRGGPAVGLAHLIGSMAGAATGALRAIMDAAQINNFQGGIKLKGGRTAGQNISVNPTQLTEIDAPPGVDDIRKLVMGFPFNGPSQVLYNLLEWLTQQAEMVVSTASEKIADAKDMPVGTALALIEHGSINFSAIHARLHNALKRDLEILHRLDAEHISDKETVEELGELVVYRSDFQGPMDIIPVSDPNIFSEAQRYAQLQSVLQLRTDPQFMGFFKPERLLRRALKLLQITDVDDIAKLPKDPKRLGPTEENLVVSKDDPAPLKAYEEQDDVAHLQVHVQYATSPLLGANPLIGAGCMPALMQHCKEHILALYKKHTRAAVEAVKTIARQQNMELSIDECEARGAAFADYALAQVLGPMIMPGLQQMQQLVGQFAPKPQPNPDVMAQTTSQERQLELRLKSDEKRATEANQLKQMLDQLKLQVTTHNEERDRAANAQAAAITAAIERMQVQSTEKIAQATLIAQRDRDELIEHNKAQLLAMKQHGDQTLAMIQAMLANKEAAPPPPPPDLSKVFEPLVKTLSEGHDALSEALIKQRTDTQEQFRMFFDQLAALKRIGLAPRTAKYVRGPDGETVGITSSVDFKE